MVGLLIMCEMNPRLPLVMLLVSLLPFLFLFRESYSSSGGEENINVISHVGQTQPQLCDFISLTCLILKAKQAGLPHFLPPVSTGLLPTDISFDLLSSE